eukprot:gene9882-biopygen15286
MRPLRRVLVRRLSGPRLLALLLPTDGVVVVGAEVIGLDADRLLSPETGREAHFSAGTGFFPPPKNRAFSRQRSRGGRVPVLRPASASSAPLPRCGASGSAFGATRAERLGMTIFDIKFHASFARARARARAPCARALARAPALALALPADAEGVPTNVRTQSPRLPEPVSGQYGQSAERTGTGTAPERWRGSTPRQRAVVTAQRRTHIVNEALFVLFGLHASLCCHGRGHLLQSEPVGQGDLPSQTSSPSLTSGCLAVFLCVSHKHASKTHSNLHGYCKERPWQCQPDALDICNASRKIMRLRRQGVQSLHSAGAVRAASEGWRRMAKPRPGSAHWMPKVQRNLPKALRACATILRTVTKQWRTLGEKSAYIRNMRKCHAGPGSFL